MKIKKRGRKRSPLLDKKITCDECGCQFQLESPEEARFVPDARDGNYYEITCPQCDNSDNYDARLF